MNDNSLLDPPDVPEWAWEIIERHDLGLRADAPLAAVIVLLTDAAFDLGELSRTAFREAALTAETRRRATACAAMIEDAVALAALCPSEPTSGTVTEADDGTLTWAPAKHPATP